MIDLRTTAATRNVATTEREYTMHTVTRYKNKADDMGQHWLLVDRKIWVELLVDGLRVQHLGSTSYAPALVAGGAVDRIILDPLTATEEALRASVLDACHAFLANELGGALDAARCSCTTNSDGTTMTVCCSVHATNDPCLTTAGVTGKRRRGSIVRGRCSHCNWTEVAQ
jgi:fructose-1,6-bisphosphatase/inositol monophosphatase family enzyme